MQIEDVRSSIKNVRPGGIAAKSKGRSKELERLEHGKIIPEKGKENPGIKDNCPVNTNEVQ